MMAFLRESDLIRVHNAGLLSESSLNNPYHDPIFDKVENGDAWLAESWRYYMYWFANFEERIGNSTTTPGELLRRAEGVWVHLEEQQVLMEEWANDGSWLRPWRRALIEAFSP